MKPRPSQTGHPGMYLHLFISPASSHLAFGKFLKPLATQFLRLSSGAMFISSFLAETLPTSGVSRLSCAPPQPPQTRSPAPGWDCHVARSSPGAPVNLGQVERLGPDRLWEVCCYPQSREQGPEPQETENRRSEFRAVVHTGCPQEYSGGS